jgi:arsenite-transporting ATPase
MPCWKSKPRGLFLSSIWFRTWAWVVNSSLAASDTNDPLLAARAQSEAPQIEQVQQKLAKRVVLVPVPAEEPVGYDRLRELTRREVQRAAP